MEKNGDYDDISEPTIKYKRGSVACLYNLLPDSENEDLHSNVYCHGSSISSVVALDLDQLKFILSKDRAKLLKLWNILVVRMIMLKKE